MSKERSPNRRRNYIELPGNYAEALNTHHAGLGDSLNYLLKQTAEGLERRAGLRGIVEQTNHMQVNDNRVLNLKDPVEMSDVVNYRTLKKWSTCKFLANRLEDSPELDDLLDQDIESSTVAPSNFLYPFAFAYHLVQPMTQAVVSPIAANNDVIVFPMLLPTDITVTKLTYNLSGTSVGKNYSIGVYSIDKTTKLIDTGVKNGGVGGRITVTISPGVTLTAGAYLLAFTADSTLLTFWCVLSDNGVHSFYNTNYNWQGKNAVASVAGALPASLGVLTQQAQNPPTVLFE